MMVKMLSCCMPSPMGQLKKARLMLEEALLGQKETLGDNHQHTRNTIGLLEATEAEL